MAANLQVTSINLSATTVTVGQEVDISFTVGNSGDASVGNTYTRFFFSTDATYDPSDRYLGQEYTGSINAGFAISDSDNFQVPMGFGPGTYYLIGVADWYESVAEDDETDNALAVPITISETPSDFPDIEVTNLSLITNPVTTTFTGGEMLTVSFDFSNNFASTAEGEFEVYWSTDSYFSNSDQFLGDLNYTVAGNVSGNQTFDVDLSNIGSDFHGDGYFFVVANMDDEIGEVITGNNISNGVAATVGTAPAGSTSYGAHVGWYYEIEKVDYTVSTWDYGWYNGGHYALGTYYGWNVGWHVVPAGWTVGWNVGWHNPGTGWQLGWHVGWYFAPASWALGWHVGWYMGWGWNTSGWSVGWHLDTETLSYFALGELKLGTQDIPYIGWNVTDLGVGIGLSMNPIATDSDHYVDYSGSYYTQQLVLDSASYTQGWLLGPSGWAMGWIAGATFTTHSELIDGYYFAGWPAEYYSPLNSWDYYADVGWGLHWGWSGYVPSWFAF
ncbi:MAG: CARDB domain-containing protein [Pseudomonadota bacterium]